MAIGGCDERLTGTNMETNRKQAEKKKTQSPKTLPILHSPTIIGLTCYYHLLPLALAKLNVLGFAGALFDEFLFHQFDG